MAWALKDDRPIYLQLVEQIKLRVLSGEYPPGGRLKSVRDLAEEAAVNPNTMQKALGELERSGLIFAQRTSGRFITEDTAMIEQLKNELAKEQITAFFETMNAIGFGRQETISLLKAVTKEGTEQ